MSGQISDHDHVITAGKKKKNKKKNHMQISIELKDPVKAQITPS